MRNTEIEVEKEAFLPPREAFLLPRDAILPFLTILSPGCKIALLVLADYTVYSKNFSSTSRRYSRICTD